MSQPNPLRENPTILNAELSDIKEVSDLLVLELSDGASTKHLAGSCYGVAVRECLSLWEDTYLLLVRSDFRQMLAKQLEPTFPIRRVYSGAHETARFILTGQLSVRFERETAVEDRRGLIEQYFVVEPGNRAPQQGVFTLKPERAKDPEAAWASLHWRAQIRTVNPGVILLPPLHELRSWETLDLPIDGSAEAPADGDSQERTPRTCLMRTLSVEDLEHVSDDGGTFPENLRTRARQLLELRRPSS